MLCVSMHDLLRVQLDQGNTEPTEGLLYRCNPMPTAAACCCCCLSLQSQQFSERKEPRMGQKEGGEAQGGCGAVGSFRGRMGCCPLQPERQGRVRPPPAEVPGRDGGDRRAEPAAVVPLLRTGPRVDVEGGDGPERQRSPPEGVITGVPPAFRARRGLEARALREEEGLADGETANGGSDQGQHPGGGVGVGRRRRRRRRPAAAVDAVLGHAGEAREG